MNTMKVTTRTEYGDLEKKRVWSASSIREMCITHRFYTKGDCMEYDHLLFDLIEDHEPTDEGILRAALDIFDHSVNDDLTVETIMFLIEREAVDTYFDLKPIQ